jgi:hypothetical protein
MLFFITPTHIAAPPTKELTNHISNGVPFVVLAPITFTRYAFTRASIATRVNEQGLIEVVPADTPRFDHDSITLAPKGLLLEEARTNIITRSNYPIVWTKARSTITNSTDFPIFANDGFYLLTDDGTAGGKGVSLFFTASSTTRAISVYLRRGTNNFAQILSGGGPNLTVFENYNLLTGVLGYRGAGSISATMIPWRDGWYRCTLTMWSPSVTSMNVFLVSSATSVRGESNTLSTNIYIAGPQMGDGTFATNYIPTAATAVT